MSQASAGGSGFSKANNAGSKIPPPSVGLDLICDGLLPTVGDRKAGLPAGAASGDSSTRGADRPFIGVKFNCCQVYSRVYLAPDKKAYRGSCPKCAKKITFEIGPGGSNKRFFEAN